MLERPPGPFQVNKSHPIYGRLGLLVAPQGDNFTNLLIPGQMGVKAAASSLTTATVPILGQSLKSAGGAASGVKFATGLTAATTNASGAIFACLQFTDATSQSVFFSTSTTATGWRFEVQSGNLNNTAQGVSAVSSTGLGLVANVPYFVGCSWDGGGQNWIVRRLDSGYTVTATSASAPGASGGDQTFVVGGRISASTGFNGYISLMGFVTASGSTADQGSKILVRALADNPWAIIRPDGYRRPYFTNSVAGGATNTPVTLSPGALTFAGTAKTFQVAKAVTLSPGALTFAGLSATFKVNRAVTLSAGGFTFAGLGQTEAVNRPVTLSPGAITFAGTAKTFQINRGVTLSPGAFTWAGVPITVTRTGNIPVTLTPGTFTLSGLPLNISVSQATTDTARSKGGYDPYYYKRRNKRRSKLEDVREFVSEVLSAPLDNAPEAVQDQQEAAKVAALQALALQHIDRQEAQAKLSQALAEINQFYVLIREQVRLAREEEEEDEMLLLLS